MNLALFDFDGTITRGDTLTPFVRQAMPGSQAGWVTLLPVVAGHLVGVVSARHLRATALRVVFQGASPAAIRDLGARYAAETLPGTVRPHALARLRWHQSQRDEIVIVSASLGAYLRPWCAAQGFGCLCNELEESHGVLTGRLQGDDVGVTKARQISQALSLARYEAVYAYGDTAEDRDMLALAHFKFYRWKQQHPRHGQA